MAEYINLEDILLHKTLIPGFAGEYVAVDRIKEAPKADVAPVRHGKWVEDGGGKWHCSECGHKMEVEDDYFDPNGLPTRFCENCGARMDLGGADNGE